MSVKTYSLFEVNSAIKRTIALNFSQEIWIKAELAQVSIKGGHRYLHLIEKDLSSEQLIIAQLNATLWSGEYQRLLISKGEEMQEVLKPGLQVLVKGIVLFNERYGLQLKITDLDLNFTQGILNNQLQLLIHRIHQEKLQLPNKNLSTPIAFKKIAVISSNSAAGYQDFEQELEKNELGAGIHRILFDTIMQGENLVQSMKISLSKVYSSSPAYDAIVIVRGGGSKIDLADFNNYDLCKMISEAPLPVYTGIGHETDQTAVDLVAAQSFKTPTAVAIFLINHNSLILKDIKDITQKIQQRIMDLISPLQNQVGLIQIKIDKKVLEIIQETKYTIKHQLQQIVNVSINKIQTQMLELASLKARISRIDYPSILLNGYVMIFQDGIQIKALYQLNKEHSFMVKFHDGNIQVEAAHSSGE